MNGNEEYKNLNTLFHNETKCVLGNRPLSTNQQTLSKYETELIQKYNNIIAFLTPQYHKLHTEIKEIINTNLKNQRSRLKLCFDKLRKQIIIPNDLLAKVYVRNNENLENTASTSTAGIGNNNTNSELVTVSDSDSDEANTEQIDLNNQELNLNLGNELDIVGIAELFLVEGNQEIEKMMEAHEFLRLCASLINQNYDGDALKLQSFVDKVELLKLSQGTHAQILKSFVISKLEGKAREYIPENTANVDAVISALKAEIKPDSSDVIIGRMMCLKLDNNALPDFTKQAEGLAEDLQRALVLEGANQAFARKKCTQEMINLCRKSTKNTNVENIIAASTFDSPSAVLSKFAIETGVQREKSKQILAFNSNKRGNFRGKNRGWNKNYNGQNRYHNNNYQNNNGYQNNFNNRGRGRFNGRFNGNRGRGGTQGTRFVRYAENLGGPSQQQQWRAIEAPQAQQQMQIVPYQQ